MPLEHQDTRVTAESTDAEIIAAIRNKGSHRYHWRKHDWRNLKPGELAWIIPNDIGYSTSRDSSLLRRLKQMVKEKTLEMSRHFRAPRFRVRPVPKV